MHIKTVDYFLELLENELRINSELRNYHRILNNDSDSYYKFRKAYFRSRLIYVLNQIDTQQASIIDIGCGYGTTSLLLAMTGHKVIGTTLEYYYDQIQNRLLYWKKYIDTSRVEIKYENLYTSNYREGQFDFIIVQDTLHHLEPISAAIQIMNSILKTNGKLIVSEENGKNIICNIKHFKERGFKRIIEVYDENLKTSYKMGNENTRSQKHWIKLLSQNGFNVPEDKIEYIRILPPFFFKNREIADILKIEMKLSKYELLRDYMFFGINFIATKK